MNDRERASSEQASLAASLGAARWAVFDLAAGLVEDAPRPGRVVVADAANNGSDAAPSIGFRSCCGGVAGTIQLYNDADCPIPGAKHRSLVGQPAKECWPEVWHVIGPLIDTPFHGGPATWMEDIFLEVNRHGFVEETHFTIAYSPVPDEAVPAGIGGVLGTVMRSPRRSWASAGWWRCVTWAAAPPRRRRQKKRAPWRPRPWRRTARTYPSSCFTSRMQTAGTHAWPVLPAFRWGSD